MKNITNELKSHLADEVTTLATCWKLTRRDGLIMGFTDHDSDIVFEPVTFVASSGFTASAVQSTSGFAVDNLDVEGMLTSEFIAEADLHAGLYDFAQIEIFLLNYANLSQGKLLVRFGWIGEVSYGKNQFVAEVRGLSQKLAQKIGSLFSPTCRAMFGDAKCGKNLNDYKFTATITAVESSQVFTTALANPAGYFNYGFLKFTSGANDDLQMEVKDYVGGKITLALPMPYEVEVGDSLEVYAGCDKLIKTCKDKFSNAINFRGEPHVPGTDRILETAGTRSK
jgi:uncharacterized phage protein (TIGR02218 family)